MQNVTTADGVASHHRDNRFRTGTDLTLEVQHVQVMYAGIIFIAAVITTHFLVTTGAERFIACASQNDHADIVVITRICQCLDHLFYRQRTEGIAHLRRIFPMRVMSGARNDMAVGSQFRRQGAEFAVTFTT